MQALPQGAPARTLEFAMGLAESLPPSNAVWFLLEAETFCSLPMDANRQQLCTALAQQMLRQTDAVEPRKTGAQLAEKLGLAPELWAPARDEVEALLLLKPARARSATRSAGDTCLPATERVTYFRRMAEVGDLMARREWRARQAAQERSK
jgi:hypothetical protein